MFNFQSAQDNVVAVEVVDSKLHLFFHDENSYKTQTIDCYFGILSSEQSDDCEEFEGRGPLKYFTKYTNYDEFEEARKALDKDKVPNVAFKDKVTLPLLVNNIRLFNKMDFASLRRMQIRLKGTMKFVVAFEIKFQDQIITFEGKEKDVIAKLQATIIALDPDVIEGFEITDRDLPMLEAAYKRLKVPAALGRNNGEMTKKRGRFTCGERQEFCNNFAIFGRHVIDTRQLVLLHDVAKRDMPSYEIEDLIEYFNLDKDISIVSFVEKVNNLLLPSYFYYTNFLPLKLGDVVLKGNGSRIETLLTGLYIANKKAFDLPSKPLSFTGAISSAQHSGIFNNVWHCDVRSLYPSLLLKLNQNPAKDEFGLFLTLLNTLRTFRLNAKDAAKKAIDAKEKAHFDALQSTFKLMINSFYGYLGFSQGSFNDFELAAKVTSSGREILTSIVEFLTSKNSTVIEMDTDGVYFVPPKNVNKEDFEQAIQSILPSGIDIELDAIYKAMFSYKAKNYALLTTDDELYLAGAALKSRGMEPVFRDFIKDVIMLLLTGTKEDIDSLYNSLKEQISNQTLDIKVLSKMEILNDSITNYKKKLATGSGRRSAIYELASNDESTNYSVGDKVFYYITGSKAKVSVVDNSKLTKDATKENRDENVAYYLSKLEEYYKTFSQFA
jgi:DNA polymerase elongation subunit (family B)